MKIKEIYKENDVVFSCEIFPPKPEDDIEIVYKTIEEIKELAPDYISVTYGAGGGTKERTLEISKTIKNNYKLETLMHLTCVNSTQSDIVNILNEVKKSGIKNILALRGDIPAGQIREEIVTDFCFAVDLVDFILKHNDFCIGVAGYPEVHPESPNEEKDTEFLRNKIEKGADFINTQLFFNNEYFYRYIDRIRSANICVPVSAGIMPVFKANLIKRMVELSGATIPVKLQSLIDKYSHKPEDMEKAGIDYASEQIIDLLKQGINGIHLYTMNKANLAKAIAKNTGLR